MDLEKRIKLENKKYGLLGYPLSHSFSKTYFENKFIRDSINNTEFDNFETHNLESFIKNTARKLNGFCVTMPYKQEIIPYLDLIESNSKKIDSINVVKRIEVDNKYLIKGYNSDYIGFEKSLLENLDKKDYRALVLGYGGVSKAVIYTLEKNNISYKIISRNPVQGISIPYNEIDKNLLSEYNLIINTTPLGMHPNIIEYPNINIDFINKEHIVFDLIYNPEETLFLKLCKAKGCKIINGYNMLCYQADEAWRIWNNK